jgi:amino acid transporter
LVNKEFGHGTRGYLFIYFLKVLGVGRLIGIYLWGPILSFFFPGILGIWSICHHNSNFPCYGAMEFQSLLTWQAQKNKELKKSRGDNKGVHTHTHTHMRLYTSIEWKLVIARSPLVGEGCFYWLVSSFKWVCIG